MTLVDQPRIDKLIEFLHRTAIMDGINAEVGVYKGGTAKIIASSCPNKQLLLFDTFKGMPKTTNHDLHKEGEFSDTSLSEVKEYLKEFSNISYYPGLFPKTAESLKNVMFSFVHLDCDIYESVKEGLNFFVPKMADSGIIVLDDYFEPNCPGAKIATDEFLSTHEYIKIFSICQSQVALKITNIWK